MVRSLCPALTKVQIRVSNGKFPPVPKRCVVTGGTGFVGQRLVEMLVERGAERVVSFDIVPKPPNAWDDPRIDWVVGDITDPAAVEAAFAGADCVWHNAAAVGPFHPRDLYYRVNHVGTKNCIAACKKHGISKMVFSSSPSTRFDGNDVDGLTEAQMPKIPQAKYMQTYAETKAMGEVEMAAACDENFLAVAVAPHQVYGPRDNLFLPNILEAAGTGRLRIFGAGDNRICFTHVDNYCHGLILGERALKRGGAAVGGFYIVTDGSTHPFKEGYLNFWKEIDVAVKGLGFTSLWAKFKLPYCLMITLGVLCSGFRMLTGITLKLNYFNVKMLTMHRWFDISAAENDLGYAPIVAYADGWADTIEWFREEWLPSFENKGLVGIAKQSQAKIDIQAQGSASVQEKEAGGSKKAR